LLPELVATGCAVPGLHGQNIGAKINLKHFLKQAALTALCLWVLAPAQANILIALAAA
jgi:hypothetical protein